MIDRAACCANSGWELADDVEVRVWDSTSELKYWNSLPELLPQFETSARLASESAGTLFDRPPQATRRVTCHVFALPSMRFATSIARMNARHQALRVRNTFTRERRVAAVVRLKELPVALRGAQINGCGACVDSATFISRRNEATASTAHLEL